MIDRMELVKVTGEEWSEFVYSKHQYSSLYGEAFRTTSVKYVIPLPQTLQHHQPVNVYIVALQLGTHPTLLPSTFATRGYMTNSFLHARHRIPLPPPCQSHPQHHCPLVLRRDTKPFSKRIISPIHHRLMLYRSSNQICHVHSVRVHLPDELEGQVQTRRDS